MKPQKNMIIMRIPYRLVKISGELWVVENKIRTVKTLLPQTKKEVKQGEKKEDHLDNSLRTSNNHNMLATGLTNDL